MCLPLEVVTPPKFLDVLILAYGVFLISQFFAKIEAHVAVEPLTNSRLTEPWTSEGGRELGWALPRRISRVAEIKKVTTQIG